MQIDQFEPMFNETIALMFTSLHTAQETTIAMPKMQNIYWMLWQHNQLTWHSVIFYQTSNWFTQPNISKVSYIATITYTYCSIREYWPALLIKHDGNFMEDTE